MTATAIDPDVLALAQSRRAPYLAAIAASGARRAGLLALLALDAELARIPHIVSEPALGHVRLQWWLDAREAIAQGVDPGHPVAAALSGLGLDAGRLGTLMQSHTFALDDAPVDADGHLAQAVARGGALADLQADLLGVDDMDARGACRRVAAARVLADAVGDGLRGANAHGGAPLCRLARDLLAQARAATLSARARRAALPILLQAKPVERRLGAPDDPLGPGAVLAVWWGGMVGRF